MKKENKFKNGDVKICNDLKSKKSVIIPFEDRFLNTLILGQIGSEKEDKVIFSMIKQDIEGEKGVTLIDSKGILAEKAYKLAKEKDREVIYINLESPVSNHSFNLLYGKEENVIESIVTAFTIYNSKMPQFFQDMNERLIRNSIKVVKRVKGNMATLEDLSDLVYNYHEEGLKMVKELIRVVPSTVEIAKENEEIVSWFLSDYFNEKMKTYENCVAFRALISNLLNREDLKEMINSKDVDKCVDFKEIIENEKILIINTSQIQLREIGKFLGLVIMLNFQMTVISRGNEDEKSRAPHFLYINEFHNFVNHFLVDLLNYSRFSKVAMHLATQSITFIPEEMIRSLVANTRNTIVFSGGSIEDGEYFSNEFELVNDEEVCATDIVYRNADEIAYRIVKENNLQKARYGIV